MMGRPWAPVPPMMKIFLGADMVDGGFCLVGWLDGWICCG